MMWSISSQRSGFIEGVISKIECSLVMLRKSGRNEAIYQSKIGGAKIKEIAAQYSISVTRAQQICDQESRARKQSKIVEKIDDWRSLPVGGARISRRLCNTLRNENFKTMGEVVDDWVSGNFDKRLPIPNFGNASRDELDDWISAHICHPSVDEGKAKLRDLERQRLTRLSPTHTVTKGLA